MKWAFSWGRSKKVSSINNGDIEALHNLVNGLTNKVNELSANLANYVTLTNANNLFVSKTQPIVLDASRDKPVKINGSTKNPVFIEFVRNNTNLGYVGLGSGNNNNINVGARSGDLCLEVSTGNKIVVNNSVIQGVANPVNNTDVSNKQYVDNLVTNNTNLINSLTNRVTTLENNKSGNNLSLMSGKVWLSNYVKSPAQVQFMNGSLFYSENISSLILNNGSSISLKNINKYLISYDYAFNAEQFMNGSINGWLVKCDTSVPHLGYINDEVVGFKVVFVARETSWITWKEKPYFQVVLLLSNSVENITKTLKSSNALVNETDENNILEITSWVNI